ncbi:MAG: hypothetical protein H6656_14580 [Ardenticatenaceae bacterium]|nr:hypothetical protein [Ardenticatenaceae bacterium]
MSTPACLPWHGWRKNGSEHKLNILKGGAAWSTFDPDTDRIWWKDGRASEFDPRVHPDPLSGALLAAKSNQRQQSEAARQAW